MKNTYIPFTKEQKHRAANADLEAWPQRRSEKPIASGKDKRLASDHSVTIRDHRWFNHSTQEGGNAIGFLQKHCGMNFQDAMLELLDDAPAVRVETCPTPLEEKKPFELPPANADMRRVFAYLINDGREPFSR